MTVAELVDLALEHGSLYGVGLGKTVTVDGRRVVTIRLGSDIFRRVWAGTPQDAWYPELVPAIDQALGEWRRRQADAASSAAAQLELGVDERAATS